MKLKISCLIALGYFLFFRAPLYAQLVATPDSTFEIKPDYGVIYRVEKAWHLTDGSILCYTKQGNFFSGKRTGSFFKILENGDLDTNYKGPSFFTLCQPGFCSCSYDTATYVLSDGRIFVFSGYGVNLDGIDQNQKAWRFSQTGEVDTTFDGSSYPYQSQLVGMDTAGFLRILPDSIIRLNTDLEKDLSFQPYSLPINWHGQKFSQENKAEILFLRLDSVKKQSYLPYSKASQSFGDLIPIAKIKGIAPKQVGTDLHSRIYEIYFSADTVSGVIYNCIRRKNRLGVLDTGYIARVKRLNPYTLPEAKTDSLGKVTVYLTSEMALRFSDSSGAFLDSIFGNPNITLRSGNELIELGKNARNRWAFVRKSLTGDIISERFSQWGANNNVQKVLMDASGKILLLGRFTDFDGWESPALVRVLPTGRVDTSFRCSVTGIPTKGSWLSFSQASNGKLIVVNSYPFGSENRFIYRIHSNGLWDSAFAQTNLGGFAYPVRVIHSATLLKNGSMFLIVAFENDTIAAKTSVIKLLPNGERDPSFTIRDASFYFSINTELSPIYGPFLGAVEQKAPGKLFLALQNVYSRPTPVCKSSQPVTIQELEQKSCLIDTSGELITTIPKPTGHCYYLPIPTSGASSPSFFLNKGYPDTLLGYSGIYKLKDNFGIDLSYRVQNHLGESPGSWYMEPILVTKDKNVFYYWGSYHMTFPWETEIYHFDQGDALFKTNPDGVIDSLFSRSGFDGRISSAVEGDSLHLYVAGNFTRYRDVAAPYLIRLNNATSTMITSRSFSQSAQIGLYPNPFSETLHMRGWQPGTRLRLVNLLGEVVYNQEVSQSTILGHSILLQRGIYFWSVFQNGMFIANGKLIRE